MRAISVRGIWSAGTGRRSPNDSVSAQLRRTEQEGPEADPVGGEDRDARKAELSLAPLGGDG